LLNRIPIWSVLAAAMFAAGAPSANATLFSGNPIADGWHFGGQSLTTGASWVGPAPDLFAGGGFAVYDLYFNHATVTAEFLTECGPTCSAWNIGDTIIGMGAVFPSDITGGNQSNTGYVFLKFGVTSSIYSLSTFSQPLGNGNRDHNNGQGGLGSVLTTLNVPAVTGVSAPTTAFQWNNVVANPGIDIAPGTYIAFSSIVGVNSLFQSFQGYLNVDLLNAQNPTGLGPFTFGGNSIVGVRDGGNPSLETNALIAAVPEPATGLLAAGALLAGLLLRRRARQ
jgi:hypothetical protein